MKKMLVIESCCECNYFIGFNHMGECQHPESDLNTVYDGFKEIHKDCPLSDYEYPEADSFLEMSSDIRGGL